jgi:4-oxalomesaconate tautomerase
MGSGIPAMWMRGGTSKALYFRREDLPDDICSRDQLLLKIMGSPDKRQIDGVGGSDPLTSKVAIISPSEDLEADIDYLFLQVAVDKAEVSDSQGCGNVLAGVGPFAIERGLVRAEAQKTTARIRMCNTGEVAEVIISTPDGKVSYDGNETIDGVPGTSAAIEIFFSNLAGSNCGSLLPTGNVSDVLDGLECTLIDNGMPCVIIKASDFGITGQENRHQLELNTEVKSAIESIRLRAGSLMELGDVTKKSVPKMTLVSESLSGGLLNTRSFIPHRVHASIGVFAAITVATACVIPNTVAASLASLPDGGIYEIEHPSGCTKVRLEFDDNGVVGRTGIIRTARKLMDGTVYS